jgi:hypothetical protein
MISEKELCNWHNEYVRLVSAPGWAVSLQTSLVLYNRLKNTRNIVAVDFGSGFSSVILRLFNDNLVFSVDHDKDWMEKTVRYLSEKGLSTAGIMSLNDFLSSEIREIDFSFYDLGSSKDVRWNNFVPCYNRMKEKGTMVLDDLHCKAGYLDFVKSCIRPESKIEILKDTTDEFGRFCGILTV